MTDGAYRLVLDEVLCAGQSSICRLGRPATLRDRKKVCLAPRTAAATLKVGPLFNRKRHVVDVTFDLRRGLKGHCLPADDTRDRTSDDHLLARDHS